MKSISINRDRPHLKAGIVAVILLLVGGAAHAEPVDSTFQIKYRSIDRVYLDGGKDHGLYPGTILGLFKSDSLLSKLEVVYSSATSASCKVLSGDDSLKNGEVLHVIVRGNVPDNPDSLDTTPSKATVHNVHTAVIDSSKRTGEGGRTSGSVALQWYSWNDESSSNFDFAQTTLRINLRARRLNGSAWSLALRTRGQYDQRNREFSTGAPGNEFVHRIYEASIMYGDNQSRWNLMAGRILPGRLSRVGYIDGAAIDLRMGSGWHAGILAGAKPLWQYQQKEISLQKYGTYLGYETDRRNDMRLEQFIAFAGEYHGNTISREMIHLYGSLQSGSRWSLYHQVDLDINRSWRKERSGKSVTLSNIYVSTRYRISRGVSLGLNYDSRQNYWTYEMQTVADSLFDSELRRGLRGSVYLRLPARIMLTSQIGYRKGSQDSSGTASYSISASKSNFFLVGTNASARYSSFTGLVSNGITYSVRIDSRIANRIYPGLSYGLYQYETNHLTETMKNPWWEAELRIETAYRLFLQGRYRKQWGGDLRGNTLQLEMGKRF